MKNIYFLGICYILIISIFSFLFMSFDKSKSRKNTNGRGRISEKTLIIMALIGGGIGSLIGMNLLRHKTKHFSFVVIFWITTVIYSLILIYFIYRYLFHV